MYEYSKGYNHRGASMGRSDIILDQDHNKKVHLEVVRLDSGGYDPGGAYWGLGGPLYVMYFDGAEEQNRMFMRAVDRDEAKTQVRTLFPNVKFYR